MYVLLTGFLPVNGDVFCGNGSGVCGCEGEWLARTEGAVVVRGVSMWSVVSGGVRWMRVVL